MSNTLQTKVNNNICWHTQANSLIFLYLINQACHYYLHFGAKHVFYWYVVVIHIVSHIIPLNKSVWFDFEVFRFVAHVTVHILHHVSVFGITGYVTYYPVCMMKYQLWHLWMMSVIIKHQRWASILCNDRVWATDTRYIVCIYLCMGICVCVCVDECM